MKVIHIHGVEKNCSTPLLQSKRTPDNMKRQLGNRNYLQDKRFLGIYVRSTLIYQVAH